MISRNKALFGLVLFASCSTIDREVQVRCNANTPTLRVYEGEQLVPSERRYGIFYVTVHGVDVDHDLRFEADGHDPVFVHLASHVSGTYVALGITTTLMCPVLAPILWAVWAGNGRLYEFEPFEPEVVMQSRGK